jgi:hypothetical protein
MLKPSLLDADRRGRVVADLQGLVDHEVSAKSGLSGGIVKAGYAAVKKVKPGFVSHAIDRMLEEFVDALEPFWAEYRAQPAPTGFGAFLAARPEPVSQALLVVTDRRAERSHRAAVTSAYNKLRPRAQENVVEALPRLGEIVERHAG